MQLIDKIMNNGAGFLFMVVMVGLVGMSLFTGISTAGWNSTVATIWPFVPIFVMLGAIMSMIMAAMKK